MRDSGGRATFIVVIVVALYILIVLRVVSLLFQPSNSIFFIIPASISLSIIVTMAVLGVGGGVPIVLGIQKLLGNSAGGQFGSEDHAHLPRTRPMPDQADPGSPQGSTLVNGAGTEVLGGSSSHTDGSGSQEGGTTAAVPGTESPMSRQQASIVADPPMDDPPNGAEEVGVPNRVVAGPVRVSGSPSQGSFMATDPPMLTAGVSPVNTSPKSDTFTTIYAKQKEYGQRVSDLLKELQLMANTIVQIPPNVLRSSSMAAYLTSDAVVLMFDRDRTMTTKPLRDFPIEVIVDVVAVCTPKLMRSVLEKKQLETGRVRSLEGAIQELEDAKTEVSKET